MDEATEVLLNTTEHPLGDLPQARLHDSSATGQGGLRRLYGACPALIAGQVCGHPSS